MWKKVLFLLCFVYVSTIFAGTIDPNTPDENYINYAKDFHYVGKLCGLYEDDNKFCASAIAIDDHHILTAAHVVKNSKSATVYFNDKEFCLIKMVIHKDFNDKEFGKADIAIGYSEKSFGLKFYPKLYENDDEVGKVCCISGYGLTGNFNTGATHSDQKKRAGSNTIDGIQDDMLICTPSKQHDSDRTSLEFFIASGDSGGGLFINNHLAGINSCVMAVDRSPKSKYNEESGHTRIQKFISWIEENKIKKQK
jgi:V8-like Glu-specific endopeptidase